MLTLEAVRVVLAANVVAHRWQAELQLPTRFALMCHDADVAARARAAQTPLLDTVGTNAARVNELCASALEQARAAIALVVGDERRYTARTLFALAARLGSLTRLNAFRLAASSLAVRLEPRALTATPARWPPADTDIDADPIDDVKYVGLFSLACYLNHRSFFFSSSSLLFPHRNEFSCRDSNVINISLTVPGAGLDGFASNRGDETAFVVTRPINVGDECSNKSVVFFCDISHVSVVFDPFFA